MVIIYVVVGSLLSRGHVIAAPNSYATCTQAGYPFTDTDPPACMVGNHTFLGAYTRPTPSQTPVSSLAFEVLVDGDSGGAYPKSQQLITDNADWVKYWSAVHAWVTLPPILPVDFSQFDVVALSDGRQPTNGYSMSVTNINTSSAGTTVYATVDEPTVTCHVSYTTSNPYYIVKTPKLAPPVMFNISTSPHRCE
ncbi:MAG TPA: protease complex subunit PrcB family protein [Candidatus Saccharimonadia bacterium]|nr:protease complex subunit PrcB family protein [Candidatus Saccharimonadia bacterium]